MALAYTTWLSAGPAHAAPSPPPQPDVALIPSAAWAPDPSFHGPDLTKSPRLTETRWAAWRRGEEVLVVGCFRASVGAWSEEIAPIAMERISALAASTALRVDPGASLAGAPLEEEGVVITQSLAGPRTHARTWLAFTGGSSPGAGAREGAAAPYAAHACMALCANGECDDALSRATLTGALAPPPPASRLLRALLALVHHPREAALGGTALLCIAAAIAIATRRRPRARLHGPATPSSPGDDSPRRRRAAREAADPGRASDRC